jgi:lipoyl(octanoyl) transferase
LKQALLLDLGRRGYRETWDLQRRIHRQVEQGQSPDTWVAVEHAPVVTLGRQAKLSNVLLSAEALRDRGVDVVEIERGGDVTYHGPGQLVVYPIIKMQRFREVVPLVRSLEKAVIECCARFGVTGTRWSEHAGVWVDDRCICAVGLAVKRMVSMHGLALNVSTALDYDRLINPCGFTDRGITSLCAETKRDVTLNEAKRALFEELAKEFEVSFSLDRAAVA